MVIPNACTPLAADSRLVHHCLLRLQNGPFSLSTLVTMPRFEDIRLLRATYLRGPSIWTYRPALEVWNQYRFFMLSANVWHAQSR